jgi:drug/metabolite transporter (DMT)-like permease
VADQGPGGRPSRLQLAAGFATIYVVWGTTYLAIRFGVETLPPFLMGGIRFVLAGVPLFLWARFRGGSWPTLSQWGASGVAGALMIFVGQGGVVWAEQRVPSGFTAVLIALVPFWMVLMTWLRPGGSRPSARSLVGLGIGFAGVLLLVGPFWQRGVGSLNLWGVGAIVLATVSWAAGSLYTRNARLHPSVRLATAMEMLVGAALLLLVGTLRGEWGMLASGHASTRSLLSLLYLVVFGSLIGLSTYTWLLSVSTPARVSTYAFVNPVIAVFLGWALAGETLTPRTLLAALVIVVAVAVVVTGQGGRAGDREQVESPAELAELVPEGKVTLSAGDGERPG